MEGFMRWSVYFLAVLAMLAMPVNPQTIASVRADRGNSSSFSESTSIVYTILYSIYTYDHMNVLYLCVNYALIASPCSLGSLT